MEAFNSIRDSQRLRSASERLLEESQQRLWLRVDGYLEGSRQRLWLRVDRSGKGVNSGSKVVGSLEERRDRALG